MKAKFIRFVGRLVRRQDGATMVEYGLVAALIAIVVIAVLKVLGGNLGELFQKIADAVKV